MLAASSQVVLVEVAVGLLLYAWGRWVAGRRGSRRWRWAPAIPIAGMIAGLLGLALSAGELTNVWEAHGIAHPVLKAEALSRAFEHLWLLMLVSQPALWLCYFAAILLFAVGSARGSSGASVPNSRSQIAV